MEFLFLLTNIALVYALARRLADSRFAGLVTALLFAYQERWASLYFDTGYVYDVLCGFFLFRRCWPMCGSGKADARRARWKPRRCWHCSCAR